MAESVARVKILAQIEGLEGFDKLKGAFKGLQQAIGPAESELAKARQQILEFGKAGARTEQVIKGQIDALKALQGQAAISGTVYRQLGKDIKDLSGAYKEAATGVKQLTDAQLKSQIVGSKPNVFDQQIAALRRGLQGIKVYTREYTDALTEIERRRLPFDAAVGRQGVIAAAEAYSQGGKGGAALPELPNTTAALNQRMSELAKELDNVARNGERWIQVQREMSRVQRQLAFQPKTPEVTAAADRLARTRGINSRSGFLSFSQGAEERVAEQSRRDLERLQTIYDRPAGPAAPSDLFRSIGGISNQIAANQLQLMGRSYEEVAQSIRRTSMASDGSLSSLQQQRAAWEQLRATISPLDKEYAQIEREARKAVNTIDGQIGRRQGGNRGGAAQIGQGAGALAASGIFGGPEGFLGSLGGSLLGAAVGGPAGFATGAFLGGSVGAYGGMGRQALGGFADYAAQLEKQRIALQGVAGSAAEYQRALQAAQSISNQFNVPIGETTQSMTQLSAAVIGAGGKVNDAELVFRNITTAIKATGGGAEQVQGALTAMAQIFSKGKVSAEELQGQLGERLPGAVTAFAEATGRTLPQLQKDLEQGVVGLNDVMKFVISLGDRYTETANKIASSDADAGQRFQKTLADFRAAIGKELVPIGAELQSAFSDFLKNITPGVIDAARGLAGAIKAIIDNAGAIANLVKFAAQMGAISLAIKAFIALKPAVSAMFAIIQLGSTQTAIAAAMASPKILALGAALKSLTLLGIITVGVNVVVNGLEQVRKVREELKSLREYDPNKAFAGSTREVVQGAVDKARDDLKNTREALQSLNAGAWKTMIPGATLFGAGPGDYQARKKLLEIDIAKAQKTLNELDPLKFPTEVEVQRDQLKKLQSELTKFEDPAGKDDGKDKAAKKAGDEAERLAAEQQRLDEALIRNGIRLDEERFRNRQELLRKEFELSQELAGRANDVWASKFLGRGSETARAVSDLLNKMRGYDVQMFSSKQGVAQAQQGLGSARALEQVTSQGIGGSSGSLSSQAKALVAAAAKLGVSPLDLATIIGFETGGTYSPSKMGGAGGNYMGLIQFGPNERKQYGAYRGQSFEEQVQGPVVKYFQDRFAGVGMSTQGADLLTLYRTVLGGNPKASLTGRDAFGTSPQSGVAAMAPHRSEALRRFFGGNAGNVPATGVASQVRRDVSAEGDVAVSQEQVEQAKKLLEFDTKRIAQLKEFDFAEFNISLTKGLKEQTLALEENFNNYRLRTQLQAEGARPEFIEAEMEKARLYREQAQLLEPLQEALSVVEDPKVKKEIQESIAGINTEYTNQIYLVEALAQAQTAQGAALANYIGQLKLQLAELTNIENVMIRIGQTVETEISTAMSTAISAVVTGSGSVKQALSDMFRNIGASFIKMATDIIAKQLVMITMQSILKALGGGLFGGGGGLGGVSTAGVPSYAMPAGGGFAAGFAFANGGIMTGSGPVPLKRYSRGGVANSPQLALYGEGSKPEAYVPLPDGRRIPVAMQAPANGGNRMRDMMGRSPAQPPSPVLNMSFQTTNIGGVEYVSRDQLESAMAATRRQAARDGAKRGMSMTLDKLQQSPSTRNRVGLR